MLMRSGQVIRRCSASPRPHCDGTPSASVWPSPRQTPGPSCQYPSDWTPSGHRPGRRQVGCLRAHKRKFWKKSRRRKFARPERLKLDAVTCSMKSSWTSPKVAVKISHNFVAFASILSLYHISPRYTAFTQILGDDWFTECPNWKFVIFFFIIVGLEYSESANKSVRQIAIAPYEGSPAMKSLYRWF